MDNKSDDQLTTIKSAIDANKQEMKYNKQESDKK